jgi:hypothetical protein
VALPQQMTPKSLSTGGSSDNKYLFIFLVWPVLDVYSSAWPIGLGLLAKGYMPVSACLYSSSSLSSFLAAGSWTLRPPLLPTAR